MTALRLETFVPLPPSVEDTGLVTPEALAAMREAGYAEGVKAGAAAATAAFNAEKTRLLPPILEALQDTILTRAEARAGALTGLRPLIETLTSVILPPLAFQGLIAEIIETISTAAEQAPEDRLILKLAPDNVDAIATALAKAPADFSIQTDTKLGPDEVQLHWAGGFDAIDLAHALNEAQAICARFFAQQNAEPPSQFQQGDINVGSSRHHPSRGHHRA